MPGADWGTRSQRSFRSVTKWGKGFANRRHARHQGHATGRATQAAVTATGHPARARLCSCTGRARQGFRSPTVAFRSAKAAPPPLAANTLSTRISCVIHHCQTEILSSESPEVIVSRLQPCFGGVLGNVSPQVFVLPDASDEMVKRLLLPEFALLPRSLVDLEGRVVKP